MCVHLIIPKLNQTKVGGVEIKTRSTHHLDGTRVLGMVSFSMRDSTSAIARPVFLGHQSETE
jgi:hypothetical protein